MARPDNSVMPSADSPTTAKDNHGSMRPFPDTTFNKLSFTEKEPLMTTAGSPRAYRKTLPATLRILTLPAVAAAPSRQPPVLVDLSRGELGQINVIPASRQPQRLVDSPSAIEVITREDIRRSGATSRPEPVRLATNLQVAQRNAQEW